MQQITLAAPVVFVCLLLSTTTTTNKQKIINIKEVVNTDDCCLGLAVIHTTDKKRVTPGSWKVLMFGNDNNEMRWQSQQINITTKTINNTAIHQLYNKREENQERFCRESLPGDINFTIAKIK